MIENRGMYPTSVEVSVVDQLVYKRVCCRNAKDCTHYLQVFPGVREPFNAEHFSDDRQAKQHLYRAEKHEY